MKRRQLERMRTRLRARLDAMERHPTEQEAATALVAEFVQWSGLRASATRKLLDREPA